MDDRHRIEPDEPLNALLDRVERGEEVVISRDGKPVARLVAAPPLANQQRPVDQQASREAAARIIERGSKMHLDGLPIRALIDEGRKY